MEQYHMQFVEKSHHLKRHGRKAFVKSLFSRSLHAFTYIFFWSDKIFQFFFKLKRIICTLLLCDKNCRSLCSFKRKGTVISPSSLALGKFLSLCTCTRSFAGANDAKSCSVRIRNAILRNHLNNQDY